MSSFLQKIHELEELILNTERMIEVNNESNTPNKKIIHKALIKHIVQLYSVYNDLLRKRILNH